MSPSHATLPTTAAQQVSRTGSFDLPYAADALFPLFSPEGEREWIKDWNPRPVFPDSIAFRRDTVFTSRRQRRGSSLEHPRCRLANAPSRVCPRRSRLTHGPHCGEGRSRHRGTQPRAGQLHHHGLRTGRSRSARTVLRAVLCRQNAQLAETDLRVSQDRVTDKIPAPKQFYVW
jgi:hypothetical protein